MLKRILRRPLPPALSTLSDATHPVLRRIYAARGVGSARELDCALGHLYSYTTLMGIDAGSELLSAHLHAQSRMMIIADFDADGATSCATLVRGLRLMGARDVQYLVPNRFAYGYGLTPEIVEVAARQQPALLITVDNGISSIEGVAEAKRRGMQVLITDHHLPGAVLPAADAIVNPNQPGDDFPSKNLAGVGVVFYLLSALRARLREEQWFTQRGLPEPSLAALLDLVALGTVADVVPLDHLNRILVAQGVGRINAGRASAGVAALLEIAGRDPARVVAADLGFAVGPRLNAAGRLDDMSLGINCLLTDDRAAALAMAQRLDALNRERREIEGRMKEQAFSSIEHLLRAAPDDMPAALCLFDAAWHQGVIGIVAGRVKDRLHRPVIAFAPAGDGVLKGSARSVAGLHIRDVLDDVASSHPGLLTKFGGHAMAAGLSLPERHLSLFTEHFEAAVRRRATPETLQNAVYTDGELSEQEQSLAFATLLRTAGPWGQGFPEPVFDGTFRVLDRRVVGEIHVKYRLQSVLGQRPIDAIAFNVPEDAVAQPAQAIQLAYKLDVNEYRGQRMPQLVVEHWLPAQSGNI